MTELPEGWLVEPLSEVADYDVGRTPARANPRYWKGGVGSIPWVAISDMQNHGTVTKTSETVSAEALEEVFHGRVVPPGTLLMSFKLTIGRVAILGIPACHNEAIISIRPRPGIDPRYLGYFLSQVDFSDHQDRQVMGNTLNRAKLDRIPVARPASEATQRAIADALDQIRTGVETHAAAERTTSALKRAAMHDLFTKGLRGEAQKETEVGPAPGGWLVEPLTTHHAVTSGGTPSRAVAEYWDGGTIPWVKTAEVDYCVIEDTAERITPAALRDSAAKLSPAGTILLAMYGQGVTRGKVAVLGIEASCNQACAAITPLDDAIETKYLYHFLSWRYEAIRQLAHGGQQQNLSLEIVRRIPVAFPQVRDEQREIVAVLDALDRKIDLHGQSYATLDEVFRSMLHKLMIGQTNVGGLEAVAELEKTLA